MNDSSEASGLSRRDVLVKGSLVAGAAWTAPMLMSTKAYAYGVSTCPSNRVCGAPDTLQFCCPQPVVAGGGTYQCTGTGAPGGVPNGCAAPGTLGGTCTNNGRGTSGCGRTSIHCNGNTSSDTCGCTKPNICGEYSAECGANTDCVAGYVCRSSFCTPSCTGSGAGTCPPGLLLPGSTFTCTNGACVAS